MYEKDKDVRLNLRINREVFESLATQADNLNVTISQYVRAIISAYVVQKEFSDEYTKTHFNN